MQAPAPQRLDELREIRDLNRLAWDSQHTDPAESIALATRCIARAQLANDSSGLAYALLNKAHHEYYFYPKELAEQTLFDIEARFTALGDRRGMLLARSGLGGILMRRQQFDAARTVLENVINAPPKHSEPLDAYYALYRLGCLHFNCGEVQAGLRYYYQALALAQREHSLPLTCYALSDIGSAQMELGNFTEAKALLEQAFVISHTTPVFFLHMILGNLANVYLEMGNADAALHLLESTASENVPFYREGDRAYLMAVKAQAYASLGRWDEAEPLAQGALDQARQDDDAEVNSHCLWQLGAIACGRGQSDVGIRWLLEAEASFGAEQNIFYVLHVYRALADAYASIAQHQTAFNYLKRYQLQYEKSLGASAQAQFFTLQIQHELAQVQVERDYALQQQVNLETLNNELRHKVGEIESLQTTLREQAMRDPLTGLYNRRILGEQLGPLLNLARRSNFAVSIVLLDMDHFKQINDTYGHGFGDQVLVELSRLIHQCIRDSDLAIRYGGEEICVVFPSTPAEDARAKIQLLLELLRHADVQVGEKSIANLTFSAGIAQFPRDGASPDALLQEADKALYQAKAAGRNRILLAS